MSFRYDVPGASGLIQGEILGEVWDHRPLYPAIEVIEGDSVEFESEMHPLVIVMSSVCDLERDFDGHFPNPDAWDSYQPLVQMRGAGDAPSFLYCLLCDLYREDRIRNRIAGSDIWKRITKNQDERYHHLLRAPIGDGADELPDLYLDFRNTIAMPTKALYGGIRMGRIKRVGTVPSVFIHDLMHRFFGYVSRVGVPS